jgi:hypothetical protein
MKRASEGGIIREVDRQPIEDLKEYRRQMGKLRGKKEILLLVQREENTFFVVLERG